MNKIFLSVLNMSLTASFVIVVIMLARLPLKKAPKIISYALWAVAGFRLVFPFTLEGIFSLIPFKSAPIPADIATQAVPRIDSGITIVDNAVSAVLPAAVPVASVNPLQIWLTVGACVWLIGMAVMLVYSLISIILLRKQLHRSELVKGNLYEADNLKTPFVIGIFHPKIYIPAGLYDEERRYIILHEQTHIRRHDHAVKMFAFFVLCLHWFNPFVWMAFLLMGADMEMSCDERVLREMGDSTKKAYSMSLLSLATERRILSGSPLAFGEGGMKERIKNVLNFKKPPRVIIIAAVILLIALTVGLAVNKVNYSTDEFRFVGPAAKTYSLENPTQKQSMERLQAIMLFDDGTAQFSPALISSYLPPKCYYSVQGGEMLFSAIIETAHDEGFYGLKDGDVIARFEIADDNTLVFKSSTVSLFADAGTRYVNNPISTPKEDPSAKLRSSWTPLADLPDDYGTYEKKEQAIANGVYINVQGQEIYNQNMVDAFYRDVSAGGGAAFMRTIEYTIEGDPIITDYQYDGDKFTVTTDSSRDKFGDYGNKNFTVKTYSYLVPHDRAKGIHVPIYYLSNEQNIYIGTSDGGLTLIDGLGRIPSPSSTALSE